MKIAILKERAPGERRCAASLDSVKKFIALGAEICVESGAGHGVDISDEAFASVGATILSRPEAVCQNAEIVLSVQAPGFDEISAIPPGTLLIAMLSPFDNLNLIGDIAARGIIAFAMEFVPRISRAQSMDALSSQSNLAGYRAVIDASYEFTRAMPMMMTAAGTVAPAKVLVLGAGVAGLQAIATARRLGAVVSAFDVRPVVKEQVESLGAKFVEVPAEENAETAGGYAKEMSEDYKRKQSLLIHETLKKTDIAISTALIPGKPAPVLITQEMVEDMRPGSVIVDLAVAAGGNCPLSRPDQIVMHRGVKLIGYTNMPSRIATDASQLYARNLYNFVAPLVNQESKLLLLDWNDEILKGSVVTYDGAIVHPMLVRG